MKEEQGEPENAEGYGAARLRISERLAVAQHYDPGADKLMVIAGMFEELRQQVIETDAQVRSAPLDRARRHAKAGLSVQAAAFDDLDRVCSQALLLLRDNAELFMAAAVEISAARREVARQQARTPEVRRTYAGLGTIKKTIVGTPTDALEARNAP